MLCSCGARPEKTDRFMVSRVNGHWCVYFFHAVAGTLETIILQSAWIALALVDKLRELGAKLSNSGTSTNNYLSLLLAVN